MQYVKNVFLLLAVCQEHKLQAPGQEQSLLFVHLENLQIPLCVMKRGGGRERERGGIYRTYWPIIQHARRTVVTTHTHTHMFIFIYKLFYRLLYICMKMTCRRCTTAPTNLLIFNGISSYTIFIVIIIKVQKFSFFYFSSLPNIRSLLVAASLSCSFSLAAAHSTWPFSHLFRILY